MELLADDQMKHAEAPSDAEMEQMFHFTTQEEIVAGNRKSAIEQETQDERNEEHKAHLQAVALLNGRPPQHKFTNIGQTERRHEALDEIVRENVEASQRNNYHE
jgi:hypothetical protein